MVDIYDPKLKAILEDCRRSQAAARGESCTEVEHDRPVHGYYAVTIKLEGTYRNDYPGAAMYANGYIANAAEEAVDKFESAILNGKVTIKRVRVNQEVEHEPAPGAVA